MRNPASASSAMPPTARIRAGADSRSGAISPTPPAAAAAEPTKTNGNSRYASCQLGTAVSATSTAVYDATAGAIPAAIRPAGRPDNRRVVRIQPGTGSASANSETAASPANGAYAVRIQVPTLIGDVTLATRSMW